MGPLRRRRRDATARRRPPTRAAWVTPTPRSIRERDFATLATLRADDWVCEWPQSGERLRGHAADVAVHSSYPGYPELHVTRTATSPEGWEMSPLLVPVRIHGAGPIAIDEGINDYPSGERWFVAQLLEVGDGKVHRETGYFGRAFEAPAWRAGLVERLRPARPALTAPRRAAAILAPWPVSPATTSPTWPISPVWA